MKFARPHHCVPVVAVFWIFFVIQMIQDVYASVLMKAILVFCYPLFCTDELIFVFPCCTNTVYECIFLTEVTSISCKIRMPFFHPYKINSGSNKSNMIDKTLIFKMPVESKTNGQCNSATSI